MFGLDPIGVGRMTGIFVALAGSMLVLGFPRQLLSKFAVVALLSITIVAMSHGSRVRL